MSLRPRSFCACAAAAALLAFAGALAEEEASVKPPSPAEYLAAHYSRHEYMIPMRDGVRLFTAAYIPKDRSQAWPILLTRTPYGVPPYGEGSTLDLPERWFGGRIKIPYMKDGYIFVMQDVRGRMKSEGEFVHVRPYNTSKRGPADIDESTDAWDTVDWLVKNLPANNGKVGVWGISYPGFYATCSMLDAHAAVKAVSPQAPVSNWFIGDDFRHNGAFFVPHAFNFLYPFAHLKPPTPIQTLDRQWELLDHGTLDGYDYFLKLLPLEKAGDAIYKGEVPYWKEIQEHDTYDDYWKARNILDHIRNIKPAVLTVGGWYDAEDLYGALETYRAAERNSPKGNNRIVMGPWVHGGWARAAGDGLGDVRFDARTSEFYREKIERPFFAHWLKGAPASEFPEAWMFETGRNQWHALGAWPPAGTSARTLHLRAQGGLGFETDSQPGFDEYVSDPMKPVPFIEEIAIGMAREYMVADQRFAARRTDVLAYQTEPLESEITVAGPIQARLRVSTTGTDSDFVVKLIDVYPATAGEPAPLAVVDPNDPDEAQAEPKRVRGYSRMGGYQQLVRGEPFRGKFRKSFEKPEPFPPGEPSAVEFSLPDVYHTFLRGHRIMVQIQSSWFPLVDINPQTFTRIAQARPEDFRKATQRVYRGGAGGSQIEVLVVPALNEASRQPRSGGAP